MKKIINIVVAVVTCFCVLACTTLTAFAESVDDKDSFYNNKVEVEFIDANGNVDFTIPIEYFDINNFVMPYEDYKNALNGIGGASTYNAANGVLGFGGGLAWSSAFAEAGLTCATGGLYVLGILAAVGAVGYAGYNLVDTIATDGVEVFYDTISLIYMNSDYETKMLLEEMFDLYYADGTLTVTEELAKALADALNGTITSDSAGNTIDTAVSVSEAYIGGVILGSMPATYPLSATNGYVQATLPGSKKDGVTYTAENDSILFTYLDSTLTMTNKITGTHMTIATASFYPSWPKLIRQISDFFLIKPEDGTAPFWTMYFTDHNGDKIEYDGKPFWFGSITSKYPLSINGTGTILDGLSFISVTWDPIEELWKYLDALGNIIWFPLDPLGLLASNTGTGVDVGGPGVAVGNPGKHTPKVPPFIPYIPTGTGTEAGPIGVPVTDTTLGDTAAEAEKDVAKDDPAPKDDPDLVLTNKDAITAFLEGISSYFDGLFDWLPVKFSDKLDGVIVSLQGIILLMAVVKIIDIIWP